MKRISIHPILLTILCLETTVHASSVDWSKFNDSVLLEITRPAGNPIGNTICTGVIVSQRLILTTAHCVSDATKIRIIFDVENGAIARQTQLLGPDSWTQHPKYDPKKSLYEFDLARIRLKETAPLSPKFIRSIPNAVALAPGRRLQRIGVGLRNGINSRNFTDPKFLSVVGNTSLETEDSFSASGDSGGPVYTASFQLIGIHSTRDDRDHKETERGYGPYLPALKKWIFSK